MSLYTRKSPKNCPESLTECPGAPFSSVNYRFCEPEEHFMPIFKAVTYWKESAHPYFVRAFTHIQERPNLLEPILWSLSTRLHYKLSSVALQEHTAVQINCTDLQETYYIYSSLCDSKEISLHLFWSRSSISLAGSSRSFIWIWNWSSKLHWQEATPCSSLYQ